LSDIEDETSATVRSAYQNYSAGFGKQKKPDNATQVHLSNGMNKGSVQHYQKLWEQAARLVLFQLGKMKKNGELPTVDYDDMDAIQEANLAVGEALKRWEPHRGTLATFLIPHIRGTLLKYANTMHNGGIGSHHVTVYTRSVDDVMPAQDLAEDIGESADNPAVTYLDNLTYEQGQGIDTPEGLMERADIYTALEQLPFMDSELLLMVHIHDVPVDQMAADRDVSRETIRRHLRSAEQRMHVALTT
jgi:RNA polymerase sigma factor (sigma-70 family)